MATEIIEAAYLAGFEPSCDTLNGIALLREATEYLTTLTR